MANKKDQILFFINRRGFAPYVLCKKCLNVFTCPRCSINLVFHKNKKILLCHYCGYNSKLNRDCKKGNVCEFVFSGPGVEKIAEEVKNLFPNKKTISRAPPECWVTHGHTRFVRLRIAYLLRKDID